MRGEIVISREDLRKMLEYSCTLPTGTYLGKRWRRDIHEPKRNAGQLGLEPEWVIGEYIPDPKHDPEMIGIRWSWAMEAPGKVWRGDLR